MGPRLRGDDDYFFEELLMKKTFFRITLAMWLFSFSHSLLALELTCPSNDSVKAVKLINASQHPYDPTYWSFVSDYFTYQERLWRVEFGTFLPTVETKSQAMRQGQIYFDQAPIVIEDAHPVDIPRYWLCEYVPNGREYFIAAVSPFEK